MEVYHYNLKYAGYGFYLELQPLFTKRNQRVVVVTSGKGFLYGEVWLQLLSLTHTLSNLFLVENTVHITAHALHVGQHGWMTRIRSQLCIICSCGQCDLH